MRHGLERARNIRVPRTWSAIMGRLMFAGRIQWTENSFQMEAAGAVQRAKDYGTVEQSQG